jgi:gamma-glutamylcyclotransferase (GGCT)/AIG2-like uncharacterized protein YtfP
MTVMFCYGSNLNIPQMRIRCPRATALGRLRLENWRLVFRGVADCVYEPQEVCYGGVWRITPECEYALDIYEGISGGMYRKEYIPIKRTPQGETEMLIYCMNSDGIFPPSEGYLKTIRNGYKHFSMPKMAYTLLDKALCEAWDDKAPSHKERQRHTRNGKPRLAEPKLVVVPVAPDMPATGK